MFSSAASKVMRVGKATVFYAVVLGVLVALVLVVAAVTAGTKLAEAAFPGKNGKIAFESYRTGNTEIFVMLPGPQTARRSPSPPTGTATTRSTA